MSRLFLLLLITELVLFGCQEKLHSDIHQSNDVSSLIKQLDEVRNINTCDGIIKNRADIATKLGKIGDIRAITPLLKVLYSHDSSVLSSGASGCTPGSKATYRAAIRALSKFGPQAVRALPRLQEMLTLPATQQFTPSLLESLMIIAPEKSLETILLAYKKNHSITDFHSNYLSTLLHYKEELTLHRDTIVELVSQLELKNKKAREKGAILSIMLYSKIETLQSAPFRLLISDAEALTFLEISALGKLSEAIQQEIRTTLLNFDEVFSGQQLKKVTVWCGSRDRRRSSSSIERQTNSVSFKKLLTKKSISSLLITEKNLIFRKNALRKISNVKKNFKYTRNLN